MTEAVVLLREGAVVRLRLNRPRHLNALDQHMAELLVLHLRTVATDP